MAYSPLSQLYPDTDWAALFTKLADLLGRNYDWSEDVAAIKSAVWLSSRTRTPSARSTLSSSSVCWAAAGATRAWTAPGGRPRGWRFCRA